VKTALILFNRDLRVDDNPALAAAARAERTLPLFVLDQALLGSSFAAPNRVAFMLEALADLDDSLRRAGGRLFLRRGDPVKEAIGLAREGGAEELHVSADWSAYATARERRLAAACEAERIAFHTHPGTTIVPPGAVTPAGGDHFKVFTPYHRAWSELPPRPEHRAPRKLLAPGRPRAGSLPELEELTGGRTSPQRAPGGEREGRRLMRAFLRGRLDGYGAAHDDLAGDATSRLSAHLRFGCLSPCG
jgi:deoxyribodipyrimidine photo-lyase